MSWDTRAHEELALFGPSFCAILLWQTASNFTGEARHAPPLETELLYLTLPLVLHGETRRSLPRNTRTSLASWVSNHPLLCLLLAERARVLVPFTREAIVFAGRYSLLAWGQDGKVRARPELKRKILAYAEGSTLEVQECIKKASLLGKWFQRAGDASTIMTTLGVQP